MSTTMRFRFGYVVLVLLGILLAAPTVVAQQVTLRGFITDRTDDQPLIEANVVLQDTLA